MGAGTQVLRRQIRERREYLYRKSLEDKEATVQERKHRLRAALEGGALRFRTEKQGERWDNPKV
jgi:hypothetical protein